MSSRPDNGRPNGMQRGLSLLSVRSSVGVESPGMTVEPLPLQPVGLMWTDVSFDEARLRLRDLTVTDEAFRADPYPGRGLRC